jgi:hypothetical protein
MIDVGRTKEIFLSLGLHFKQPKYDFYKYNGKLRNCELKPTEFWFRKFAARLQTEENVINFFVANFVDGYCQHNRIEGFARNFCHKENFNIYKAWQARMNSLHYNFQKELADHSVKDLIEIKDGQHPLIFSLYLGKKMSLETICVLTVCIPKLLEYWRSTTTDPILLPEFCTFCEKYRTFFSIDKQKFTAILQEKNVEFNQQV